MITNKDIRVENGNLVLNGDKFPLDGQSPETIMEIVVDNSDSTPTENSTAPVTSGGVYTALDTAREQIANKIKKLPTQVTRYNFTEANTYEYTGVSVTCPAGHTYIVRAFLTYSNSEPKGIAASSKSNAMRLFECYAREELCASVNFMLIGGETAYIWCKGTTTNGDDVNLDIVDITN